MNYTKIKFTFNPYFFQVLDWVKEYYIIRDVNANGGYSIILELAPNGRVNNTLFGY